MSGMIDRVARALQDGDDAFPSGAPIDPWYRGAAMAAIEAMREPTAMMLRKGDDTFTDRDFDYREPLKEAYHAMVDEALK